MDSKKDRYITRIYLVPGTLSICSCCLKVKTNYRSSSLFTKARDKPCSPKQSFCPLRQRFFMPWIKIVFSVISCISPSFNRVSAKKLMISSLNSKNRPIDTNAKHHWKSRLWIDDSYKDFVLIKKKNPIKIRTVRTFYFGSRHLVMDWELELLT